jgi:hypothetical protein
MPKGPEDERKTCKTLGMWWGGREDIFWRTSQSGGRATTRAKQKKLTAYAYGDITFTDPTGKPLIDLLLIENKVGYTEKHKVVTSKKTGKVTVQKAIGGINALDFVDSLSAQKAPLLMQWWTKAEQERVLAGRKYSAIIFNRTRRLKCIMIEKRLFDKIQSHEGLWDAATQGCQLQLKLDNFIFIIITLEDFLEWCKPATIRSLAKRKQLIKRRKK